MDELMALLRADGIRLAYDQSKALVDASLSVSAGESVALTGPSGAGKTSLLYCLAGIIEPDAGHVTLDGAVVSPAPDEQRRRLRRENYGFVFQFAELVPELTLSENVELPLRLLGRSPRTCAAVAAPLMTQLGLAALGSRRPGEVSGGQAQRAAVARALVHQPKVVFADEPTGSLDRQAGQLVLDELLKLCGEHGAALVVVTHDDHIAQLVDRQVHMSDGRCDGRMS